MRVGAERMTRVLAFNCSPKMENSNTTLILTPFLEGMKEAGADVELFYVRRLDIKPCTGGLHCWTTHPGKCHHDDYMRQLYPKFQRADIWVFATPVYVDGISGSMKDLLDRMIPLVEPFFELRSEHCRHPLREGTKSGKIVLVSNCGFWEMDNFEPMLVHMKAVCKNMNREFAGALLRPHGSALRQMMKMDMLVEDVFEAAKEAGSQLVQKGEMSDENLRKVSRELLPLKTYVNEINKAFKQALDSYQR